MSNSTLLARGDDIQKVAGGKVLVQELVVAEQGEHGLVLVGQKAFLDTYVTRPGDVQNVLVIRLPPSFHSPFISIAFCILLTPILR